MPYKNKEDKMAWQRNNKEKCKEYYQTWLSGEKGQRFLEKQKQKRELQKLSRPKKIRLPKNSYQKSRRKIRLETIEMMGGSCVACGMDDERCLEFDHIKPVGKSRLRSETHQEIRKMQKQGINPKEYFQILCANCHSIKTKENGEQGGRYWIENDPLVIVYEDQKKQLSLL